MNKVDGKHSSCDEGRRYNAIEIAICCTNVVLNKKATTIVRL